MSRWRLVCRSPGVTAGRLVTADADNHRLVLVGQETWEPSATTTVWQVECARGGELESTMRRITFVIFAGLAMVGAGVVGAGQTVIAQDGGVIDNAVIAQAGRSVRPGSASVSAHLSRSSPMRMGTSICQASRSPAMRSWMPSPEKRLPPVHCSGRSPGAPAELASGSWTATDGRLDLPCRGDERIVVSAPGYAPTAEQITVDGRRHTLLLHPQGALTIELEPPLEARMWLAREERINVTNLFFSVAEKHHIGADGLLEINRPRSGRPLCGR